MYLSCIQIYAGAKIGIVNNCLLVKTVCETSNQKPVTCYVLNSGGDTKQIDVGSYREAGLIWGFNGNLANGTNAKP
jgi:hypothetical protein